MCEEEEEGEERSWHRVHFHLSQFIQVTNNGWSSPVEVVIIMTGIGYDLEPPYVRRSELHSTLDVRSTGALS